MSSEAKRPILLLLVVLASAASAVAGYNEGMSAYRAGDYETALLELLDAASQGHPKAEYRLGCMYDAGKGVAIDPVEAARWLQRSAEQGHAPAQSYLGYLHREGRGVEQDYEEVEPNHWVLRSGIAPDGRTPGDTKLAEPVQPGAWSNPALGPR